MKSEPPESHINLIPFLGTFGQIPFFFDLHSLQGVYVWYLNLFRYA